MTTIVNMLVLLEIASFWQTQTNAQTHAHIHAHTHAQPLSVRQNAPYQPLDYIATTYANHQLNNKENHQNRYLRVLKSPILSSSANTMQRYSLMWKQIALRRNHHKTEETRGNTIKLKRDNTKVNNQKHKNQSDTESLNHDYLMQTRFVPNSPTPINFQHHFIHSKVISKPNITEIESKFMKNSDDEKRFRRDIVRAAMQSAMKNLFETNLSHTPRPGDRDTAPSRRSG